MKFKILAILIQFLYLFGCGNNSPYSHDLTVDSPITELPVFVINLKRSPERRQHMKKVLHSAGLLQEHYEFIEGIDGLVFAPFCGERRCVNVHPRSVRPTEEVHITPNGDFYWKQSSFESLVRENKLANETNMGPKHAANAMSHIQIWKKMVDKNIPWAIILEDDVEIAPNAKPFTTESYPAEAEVIFLTSTMICGNPHGHVNYGYGTAAYAISLKGAKKSLEIFSTIYVPVDLQWTQHFKHFSKATDLSDFDLKYRKNISINAYCHYRPPFRLSTLSRHSITDQIE